MPTISPRDTVLVTGANGFIGQWAVRELLQRGYAVHGAVRTTEKAQALTAWIAEGLPAYTSRFKTFVVPDIAKDGAFDEAIAGVQGVIHAASPVTHWIEELEPYIIPAVNGTTGILKSAQSAQTSSTVKRIVITGSTANMANTFAPARTYTEADWNESVIGTIEREGKAAPGAIKYDASKTMAEKAAWKFMEENKDSFSFDLSVVSPSWAFGPIADETTPSPDAMTSTAGMLYKILFMVPPLGPYPDCYFNYVDVRDSVDMQIKALEVEAAGGERIISNSHLITWAECVEAVNVLGVLPGFSKIERHFKREYPPAPYFSNEKAIRIFGIRLRTIQDTLKDIVEQWKSLGWLKHLEA
ncbi:NAD-P-binding protein [Cubamyces sp. BRFM 1775]|nr:NAD-P-binding protein [Cubamyces sp. BRFM 1775]